MSKAVSWFFTLVLALLPLILGAEDTGTGAEKKTKVVSEILAALKDPNVPFNIPTWLPEGILNWVLSLLVDVLVSQLNKTGFFGK